MTQAVGAAGFVELGDRDLRINVTSLRGETIAFDLSSFVESPGGWGNERYDITTIQPSTSNLTSLRFGWFNLYPGTIEGISISNSSFIWLAHTTVTQV